MIPMAIKTPESEYHMCVVVATKKDNKVNFKIFDPSKALQLENKERVKQIFGYYIYDNLDKENYILSPEKAIQDELTKKSQLFKGTCTGISTEYINYMIDTKQKAKKLTEQQGEIIQERYVTDVTKNGLHHAISGKQQTEQQAVKQETKSQDKPSVEEKKTTVEDKPLPETKQVANGIMTVIKGENKATVESKVLQNTQIKPTLKRPHRNVMPHTISTDSQSLNQIKDSSAIQPSQSSVLPKPSISVLPKPSIEQQPLNKTLSFKSNMITTTKKVNSKPEEIKPILDTRPEDMKPTIDARPEDMKPTIDARPEDMTLEEVQKAQKAYEEALQAQNTLQEKTTTVENKPQDKLSVKEKTTTVKNKPQDKPSVEENKNSVFKENKTVIEEKQQAQPVVKNEIVDKKEVKPEAVSVAVNDTDKKPIKEEVTVRNAPVETPKQYFIKTEFVDGKLNMTLIEYKEEHNKDYAKFYNDNHILFTKGADRYGCLFTEERANKIINDSTTTNTYNNIFIYTDNKYVSKNEYIQKKKEEEQKKKEEEQKKKEEEQKRQKEEEQKKKELSGISSLKDINKNNQVKETSKRGFSFIGRLSNFFGKKSTNSEKQTLLNTSEEKKTSKGRW